MCNTSKSNPQKQMYSRKGSFADILVGLIRERRNGNAPSVYAAARIDRRTYSSIISNPFRSVSKRTALQFALALRLDREGADRLLLAAGYALSPAIPEDIAFASFFENQEYDMVRISEKLNELGFKAVG